MFMIRMLTRDLLAAANVLVITRQLHSMQSAILFKQFCPPVRHILYVNERGYRLLFLASGPQLINDTAVTKF